MPKKSSQKSQAVTPSSSSVPALQTSVVRSVLSAPVPTPTVTSAPTRSSVVLPSVVDSVADPVQPIDVEPIQVMCSFPESRRRQFYIVRMTNSATVAETVLKAYSTSTLSSLPSLVVVSSMEWVRLDATLDSLSSSDPDLLSLECHVATDINEAFVLSAEKLRDAALKRDAASSKLVNREYLTNIFGPRRISSLLRSTAEYLALEDVVEIAVQFLRNDFHSTPPRIQWKSIPGFPGVLPVRISQKNPAISDTVVFELDDYFLQHDPKYSTGGAETSSDPEEALSREEQEVYGKNLIRSRPVKDAKSEIIKKLDIQREQRISTVQILTGYSGGGKTKAIMSLATSSYAMLFDFSEVDFEQQTDTRNLLVALQRSYIETAKAAHHEVPAWKNVWFGEGFDCCVRKLIFCRCLFLLVAMQEGVVKGDPGSLESRICWRNLQMTYDLTVLKPMFDRLLHPLPAFDVLFALLITTMEQRGLRFFVSFDEMQKFDYEIVRFVGAIPNTSRNDTTDSPRPRSIVSTLVRVCADPRSGHSVHTILSGTQLRLRDETVDVSSRLLKLGRNTDDEDPETYMYTVDNSFGVFDVMLFIEHYLPWFELFLPSQKQAIVKLLVGRPRIVAMFVSHIFSTLLKKDVQRLSFEEMMQCHAEYIQLALDPSEYAKNSVVSMVRSWVSGGWGAGNLRDYGVSRKLYLTGVLLEMLEAYELSGDEILLLVDTSFDLVSSGLASLVKVGAKKSVYRFGEPLVVKACLQVLEQALQGRSRADLRDMMRGSGISQISQIQVPAKPTDDLA